jgi:general secretion pathway protein G
MNRQQAGVTLIEMLVVVTIIGLFASLVVPKMVGTLEKAKVAAAHDQIRSFKTALLAYKIDAGTFPTTEQGLEAVRDPTPTGTIVDGFHKIEWETPFARGCAWEPAERR